MPILSKPIITEKSLTDAKNGRYTFAVELAATKDQIKAEAEKLFGVNVIGVQTLRVPGKSYRTGRRWLMKMRNDWKKAVIEVKKGQNIKLFDIKTE